ncbi:MAG TPA: SDR family NAD(P)-dependent oxidoreductase [Ktedonobacterales bacterium]|nr:SDR family NAD(P)-dependent oxidoreductase [Ktedonobacterales bacterium]
MARKIALVTGSGRNIGRAIALERATHSANVIVNAHTNEGEASAVAREAERLSVRSQEVTDVIEKRARCALPPARHSAGHGARTG